MEDKWQYGYFCEDCGKILTPSEYMYHNADHWIKKIRFIIEDVIWEGKK
jgi:hypothetical protein